MPRKLVNDDMPRRRRSRQAAIDADAERSLVLRIFLHSPKDIVAGAIALAAVSAIITNALFMQAGRHPAPMFGTVTAMPAVASAASPMPRSRPVDADASMPEPRIAESRGNEPKVDPLASLVKSTSTVQAASTNIPRPPMAVPVPSRVESVPMSVGGSRRVAAVQRALTDYGYGQLKPTGLAGADTQAAIQKFERARKLPVTGQVSDRLVRELATVIGHSVE